MTSFLYFQRSCFLFTRSLVYKNHGLCPLMSMPEILVSCSVTPSTASTSRQTSALSMAANNMALYRSMSPLSCFFLSPAVSMKVNFHRCVQMAYLSRLCITGYPDYPRSSPRILFMKIPTVVFYDAHRSSSVSSISSGEKYLYISSKVLLCPICEKTKYLPVLLTRL